MTKSDDHSSVTFGISNKEKAYLKENIAVWGNKRVLGVGYLKCIYHKMFSEIALGGKMVRQL